MTRVSNDMLENKISSRKNLTPIFWVALAAALISADLGTKWLAKNFLQTPIDVWPGIAKLSLSFNSGIAFSIPVPNAVMIIAAPLLTGILVWLIAASCKISHPATKFSLALLISGALGNAINRIWTSAVIDFIDFSFWPSFNLADSYLTLAVFLLILFYGKITVTNHDGPK